MSATIAIIVKLLFESALCVNVYSPSWEHPNLAHTCRMPTGHFFRHWQDIKGIIVIESLRARSSRALCDRGGPSNVPPTGDG